MRRTLYVITVLLLAAALGSCSSSSSPSSGTSLVSITIGSDHAAKLSAERATFFAKLRSFLRGRFGAGAAYAAIPSNVASVKVTVQASDMTTLTSTVDATGMSSVTVTFEVPNGRNREFIVSAFDASGNFAYWGRAFASLDGADVILPVTMVDLGSVNGTIWVSTSGSDATGDGTEAKPYRTVTHALGATNSPTGILVEAGTYNAAGGEVYPLQLNAGTALVCLGANHSTVLDDTGAAAVNAMITGAQNARIDGCKVAVSLFSTVIDDGGTVLSVNNSYVQAPGSSFLTPTSTGINLSSDSTVSNSTIYGIYDDGGGTGIRINSGNPTISQCTITANAYGISVAGGSPTITGNTISGNGSYGVQMGGAVNAPTIAGNSFDHNGTGFYISVAGSSSIHNNKFFCNTSVDFYLVDPAAGGFDITNNAWDHDSSTSVTGPTISSDLGGCPAGEDICYSYLLTTPPVLSPFLAAVPGGCM